MTARDDVNFPLYGPDRTSEPYVFLDSVQVSIAAAVGEILEREFPDCHISDAEVRGALSLRLNGREFGSWSTAGINGWWFKPGGRP